VARINQIVAELQGDERDEARRRAAGHQNGAEDVR
jgi:hypothetical protein